MNYFKNTDFTFFVKEIEEWSFSIFWNLMQSLKLQIYFHIRIRFFFLVRHMKILFILLFTDIDIRIQFFYLIFPNQNVCKTYLKYRTFHLWNFEKITQVLLTSWQWSQMKAVHTLHVILNNLILKIAKRKKWHRFAFFQKKKF